MILGNSLKIAEKFVQDNSPAILSAIAVVGTVSTAYFTYRGTQKADELVLLELDRLEMVTPNADSWELSNTDKFKLVWKEYVPAVGSTVLTITCIVCANRISARRAAAMAVAYSISEKRFGEYKEKITEKLGVNKEQAAKDELAQAKVNQNPLGDNNIVMLGGDHLCYDTYTGRYFRSSIEKIKQAQNDMNYEMLHNEYASLNDFYNKIGLGRIKIGEEVGWTRDHLIEITYSTVLADNNEPCLALEYSVMPVRGYDISGIGHP